MFLNLSFLSCGGKSTKTDAVASTLSTTLKSIDAEFSGDDLGDASNEHKVTCAGGTRTAMEEKETDTEDCFHNSGVTEKEKRGKKSVLT